MAAAEPPTISSIATNENEDLSTSIDPFWDSTPRTVPFDPELELMLSVRQVVPVPPNNAPPRPPRTPHPVAARRPQCTHVTMNRLFGDHRCHNCGRVPAIGFLYSCQQDRLLQHDHFRPSMDALPAVADSANFFEAQAKGAESIGMSRTIIKQMRDGEYSYDQIEKLLQQRRHVLDVIRQAECTPSQSSLPPSPRKGKLVPIGKPEQPAELVIASAGMTAAPQVQPVAGNSLPMTPAGTPNNTPSISTTTTPNRKSLSGVPCDFQVCHSCRPFFTDRLYSSVDAVYNNEMPAVSADDRFKLRVLDANIVNNLGLRSTPPTPHLVTSPRTDDYDSGLYLRQGDGYDDESPGCTPTDTSYSGESHWLSHCEPDTLPCPGLGFCPVWSENTGCAYDNGFDDGKRGINHYASLIYEFHDSKARPTLASRAFTSATPVGSSSAGSSVSLPTPKAEPLTPPTPDNPSFGIDLQNHFSKAGKAATVCGVLSTDGQYRDDYTDSPIQDDDGRSSNSSFGEEVEVDGGVALTEEAVERGVPDIADE